MENTRKKETQNNKIILKKSMLKINYMIPYLWMRSDPNGFEKLKISFIVVKICIKNNGAEREREREIYYIFSYLCSDYFMGRLQWDILYSAASTYP